MQAVNLASNAFTGSVPMTYSNWTQVSDILAETLCKLAVQEAYTTLSLHMQVLYVSLADNQLSGNIPNFPSALILDFSSNRLQPSPLDIMPSGLQILKLANNSMSGNLTMYMTPANLTLVHLSYNLLSGSLPADMPNNLSVLNISHNTFTGRLPSEWSTLTSLAELKMDNNDFTGKLPSAWSLWGRNTANSLQLSLVDAGLQGHMPQQWVKQFCLAIDRTSEVHVLFEPVPVSDPYSNIEGPIVTVGSLLEIPAQHATSMSP